MSRVRVRSFINRDLQTRYVVEKYYPFNMFTGGLINQLVNLPYWERHPNSKFVSFGNRDDAMHHARILKEEDRAEENEQEVLDVTIANFKPQNTEI